MGMETQLGRAGMGHGVLNPTERTRWGNTSYAPPPENERSSRRISERLIAYCVENSATIAVLQIRTIKL